MKMNMRQWTTVIAAAGLVFAASGVAAAAGLLSHYKFDDDTLNSVIGSYDGTARGDAKYWPGDASKNLTVDAEDAAILGANWLTTGANWSKGDFNGDTVVDDKDATILATNMGLTEVGGDPVLPQFVTGKAGKALEFDATYYQGVNTTTSGYPNGTANACTFSVWAKSTEPGLSNPNFGDFFGGMHSPGKVTAMSFNADNTTSANPGRLRLALRSQQNHWFQMYTAPIGAGGIDNWLDGQWHHIVATWDSRNDATFQGAIYIDGVAQPLITMLDAIPATDTFITPTTTPMYLGATGHIDNAVTHEYVYAPFDGTLDDVQIYDGMIQAADAVWLYNHPGEALAAAAAVPEPSMLILLCAAAAVMFLRRRVMKMNMRQWTTVIAALGLVFATSGIAPALELLSYYKFDNDTLNSVLGSPDGTARGDTGLPQYVAGVAGMALEFETTDYQAVDTTRSGYPNGTANACTVSFWAKTTQPGGTLGFATLGGAADSGKTAISWNGENMTTVTPGRLRAAMRSAENHWLYLYSNYIGDPAGSITDWLDGEWHHIVFAWDSTDDVTYRGAIYIDGVAQPLTRATDDIPATDTFKTPTAYPMMIGATGHSAGTSAHGWAYAPYDGTMDDVQIYDSMISAENAAWLYNHPGEPLEGTMPTYLPGDANGDKTVDADDAAILAQNWLATGANWGMGDFNNDTIVDDKDATMMATNWGVTQTASVPEPSMLMLICAASAMLLLRRRRMANVSNQD